ncbi:short chain dehydrogenase/reductase family [Phyllosticta paracitricarpa]
MDAATPVDPSSIFSAKDLVVAITGGGTGIGLAMTAAVYKTGARKVYILGRRLSVLEEAAKSLDPSGKTIVPLTCDITALASIREAVARIEADAGWLDVLVNNSGRIGPSNKAALEAQSIEELRDVLLTGLTDDTLNEFNSTLITNASSVVAASASFLPLLAKGNERRGCQIITTASIAGFNRGITAGVAYSASKAAAVHLGKILATLLVPWGVRSNVVAPGIYPSAMTGESDAEYISSQVPLGKKGSFDDIAGLILYMVGKGGSYLNGSVQVSDGGRLSGFPSTY